MSADSVWVQIECRAASLYSYRIPNFNSFYALAAPVPSPSAVKLGLVSSIIEATGEVEQGRMLFAALRDAQIALSPPQRVAASRVLIKRLKKPKQAGAGFTTSFGIREYLHPEGPLTLWVQVPEASADACMLGAGHLRRIGTTDSLVTTTATVVAKPDMAICARPMCDIPLDAEQIRGRLVMPLNDLTPKAELTHFAPDGKGSSRALQTRMYLLPLRIAKQGANWLLYERLPFGES
jgi:CRISPR-associated Cas5-like protein